MKNVLLLGSSNISRFTKCKINNYTVINKGIPSLLTDEMFSNSYKKKVFTNEKYDYLFFYCGSNDLIKGVPPHTVFENINNFITNIKNFYPGINIIIISILNSPNNHRLNIINDVNIVNQNLKKISGVKVLNVNRELSNPKYYEKDGIHFNDLAYEKLNGLLEEKM